MTRTGRLLSFGINEDEATKLRSDEVGGTNVGAFDSKLLELFADDIMESSPQELKKIVNNKAKVGNINTRCTENLQKEFFWL